MSSSRGGSPGPMRPDWSFRWEAPPGAGERQIVAVVYAGDAVIDRFHIKTRKVGATQEVDVSLVQLYPVVVDRRGRFVKGLELADFDVLDQGRPVEVQNFAERTSDSSLALLLDVSQSMEEKIGVVRTACARFVDQLGDRHATSLYAFNHGLQRLAPLERNPGAVKAAVAGLTAGGGTALYDALIQVFDDLKRISGRRAVVVFSDGRDERSLSSWDAVARAGRAGDVIIYAVGTQSNEDSRRSRDDLVSMAEETGGRAFFIKRAEDLRGVLADILLDLDAQYVLSYPPPEGPAGTRAVEVRTADGKYKVRCRQQYVYGGR